MIDAIRIMLQIGMARTLRVDMPRASSEGGRDLDRVRSALVAATLTQETKPMRLWQSRLSCQCAHLLASRPRLLRMPGLSERPRRFSGFCTNMTCFAINCEN